MNKPILSRVSAFALLAALGGCVNIGGSGELPESLLTLTPTSTSAAGSTASGSLANAIAVIQPDAPQRLNVTRVPVQVNDAQVAYLQDAIWVEKPARLFRRLLAETISARSDRLVVDGGDPDMAAQTRLYGNLLDMGYDVRTSSVVVRYDAIRQFTNGEIQTRRFESVVPGVAANAAAVGPALNEAANDVAVQVADWVG
ncbi:ABC-type transport auxiliary lipoprotein family protein [Altererythrobacter sp. ZODW24]|uniref:ABC-type transport auxiliary lipoprotein family protein n=1 Tax=Altererythrobacter sp. ZODW24 TaxID=2185142 RepID=UPI000DF82943|nr:ABC-type transport auxiliary lipoprotein family protein [Altererythrobacter sp. ZODW24]